MLIEKTGLQGSLTGKVILLTGAGGGIGFEAARALVWMGATVLIAEVDKQKGAAAEGAINRELGCDRAVFYEIDLSDETQIQALYTFILNKYGFLDVIFNNATVTPIGSIDEVPVTEWDKSYAVNLRAPVLLTRLFVPLMKKRNTGAIIFVPSSGAAPYMGAYEVFKTSQVELGYTIAAELENTDIRVFSIGPGLVKTDTAMTQIVKIAARMGISIEEFYEINKNHILDVESAGTGFALSVALADKYSGQEIGCIQVLIDAGITAREGESEENTFSEEQKKAIQKSVLNVRRVYEEQYAGWLKRSIFERQWVLRDFKKVMKLSAEQVKESLMKIEASVCQGDIDPVKKEQELFVSLLAYYEHQLKLLRGYEKDPMKAEENAKIISGWMEDIKTVLHFLD